MQKNVARSPYRESADGPRSLTDRVRDQVRAAEARLTVAPASSERPAETRALWSVFEDFGDARRQHRRDTGDPALPELRDATHAFRRKPSLEALVIVAGFLDERGLLT